MRYDKSKKMVKKLLNKEMKKTNDHVEILPLTKIDFLLRKLKNDIYFKDIKIKDYKEISGLYNMIIYDKYKTGVPNIYNIIYMHLDVIKNDSKDKYEYLYNLLTTLYHEYHHKLKYVPEKDNQIDEFKDNIEVFIKDHPNLGLYNLYHDDFYFEITANLYSVTKTEEFLNKYPNIYKKLKKQLEYDKIVYQLNYINYDIQLFLNYIYKNINKIKNLPETLDILYDKEYKFKPINELYKDELWVSYDEIIQKIILSSKSYLNNQDLTKLPQEELQILLDSLKYSYCYELNRYQKNKELKIYVIKNINIFSKDEITELQQMINHKLKNNYNKLNYLKKKTKKINDLIISPKKLIYKKQN